MTDEISQEVREAYAFPEDLTNVHNYLDKRAESTRKFMNWHDVRGEFMIHRVLPFMFGAFFLTRTLTPLGGVARRMKEIRQGKLVSLLDRLGVIGGFGYLGYQLRAGTYIPNVYSTGELE